MRTISINSERSYEVIIDHVWEEHLILALEGRERAAIIVSKSFVPDFKAVLAIDCDIHIFEVPDGEETKSTEVLRDIWNWLGAAGFTRSDVIVGVGGGSVTDLSGFAAATWLRGVDWIAVPTTLAGMVDAAIGGKTGINSDYGKNLMGAFHSPLCVIIDLEFLSTLSKRDLSAGLAEVVKCGFIADPEILKLCHRLDLSTFNSQSQIVEELIFRSVSVKASVVSVDFKESFAREALNYGHTLGHAIELHSKFSLRHGEAVSIGLVYAAELALGRSLIDAEIVRSHRELLARFNLPITYSRQAWQQLLPLVSLDKKARGKKIRFVVLNAVGSTQRLEDLSSSELELAYERISI